MSKCICGHSHHFEDDFKGIRRAHEYQAEVAEGNDFCESCRRDHLYDTDEWPSASCVEEAEGPQYPAYFRLWDRSRGSEN